MACFLKYQKIEEVPSLIKSKLDTICVEGNFDEKAGWYSIKVQQKYGR